MSGEERETELKFLAMEERNWTRGIQEDLANNQPERAAIGIEQRDKLHEENPDLREYMIKEQIQEAKDKMSSLAPEGLPVDSGVEGNVTPMGVAGQAQSAERTV